MIMTAPRVPDYRGSAVFGGLNALAARLRWESQAVISLTLFQPRLQIPADTIDAPGGAAAPGDPFQVSVGEFAL